VIARKRFTGNGVLDLPFSAQGPNMSLPVTAVKYIIICICLCFVSAACVPHREVQLIASDGLARTSGRCLSRGDARSVPRASKFDAQVKFLFVHGSCSLCWCIRSRPNAHLRCLLVTVLLVRFGPAFFCTGSEEESDCDGCEINHHMHLFQLHASRLHVDKQVPYRAEQLIIHTSTVGLAHRCISYIYAADAHACMHAACVRASKLRSLRAQKRRRICMSGENRQIHNIWWSADHQLLCPGRLVGGVPRQGPARLITVCARPPRGAGSLSSSSTVGSSTCRHHTSSTHRHTHAQTHTYQHAWKHPLSSSLAGSGMRAARRVGAGRHAIQK
jgi:hypothetical protein